MKEEVKLQINGQHTHFTRKLLFWAIIVILLGISFMIIRPFVIALISAFVLAYLIRPVYTSLSRKINHKIAAILCIIIVVGILILPFIVIVGGVISQINSSLNVDLITNQFASAEIFDNEYIVMIKEKALAFLLQQLSTAVSYLPYLIISGAMTLFAIYYILLGWENLADKFELILPFRDKKKVRKEVSEITRNIVYGYLFIAILEFIVAVIGFYVSGVGAFLLLPTLIAMFAFIPGLGPGIIWVPTALYYLLNQDYGTGIGVIITGLVISVVIETLLLGRIVGGKSNIHPLVFLLGVLGGVPIFGIFGFIIGPLILVYAIKLIEESILTN